MKKMKNIALAVAIISFVVGFSDLQENILFWVARPVSAIFAIIYFLFVLLEKPFIEHDQETGSKKNIRGKAVGKGEGYIRVDDSNFLIASK